MVGHGGNLTRDGRVNDKGAPCEEIVRLLPQDHVALTSLPDAVEVEQA